MMTDEEFLALFENGTLPCTEWRHRSHVKIAYLYLRQHPFEQALEKMRRNIQRYNTATNTPDELARGYHETMTVAWMRLVHFALCESGPAASADEFLERAAPLLHKEKLLEFYSRDYLFSWRAKAEFVEPDQKALPSSSKQAVNAGS